MKQEEKQMNTISDDILDAWSAGGHRTALGASLVALAADHEDLITLTADLTPTARLTEFKATYPQRFFDVGIAEQNLIDFSGGLAREGLRPVAVTLAALAPMRCAEQMRSVLGYMNLNVTVVGIEAGVRFGPLGNTHYAMDDIAVARAIPNLTVITPSDPLSVYKALEAAQTHEGPVYIRLTGGPGFPVLYRGDMDFQIGTAIEYRAGTDVVCITSGSLLAQTIAAADILEEQGISVQIIDMHTIKPLDTDMLDTLFSRQKLIVTIEEHSPIGGLGSAVAEYKAGVKDSPRQIMCSLGDSFKTLGDHEFLLKKCGLDAEGIAATIKQNL